MALGVEDCEFVPVLHQQIYSHPHIIVSTPNISLYTYILTPRFGLTCSIGGLNASYIVQIVTILDQTWINHLQANSSYEMNEYMSIPQLQIVRRSSILKISFLSLKWKDFYFVVENIESQEQNCKLLDFA